MDTALQPWAVIATVNQRFAGKAIARGIVLWFAAALAVSASGLFFYATPQIVAATVWTLTGTSLILIWRVESIRRVVFAADLRWLIAVHLVRFAGIEFIAIYLDDRFPFSFGLLGGVGDTLVALGAVCMLAVARPPVSGWRRHVVFWWNVAGLADITAVVFAALREGLYNSELMAPLRQFPLSLLPTFFVPILIVSHVAIAVRVWITSELPTLPAEVADGVGRRTITAPKSGPNFFGDAL